MDKFFKTAEKITLAIIGGILGLIIGALVRLLALPTVLDSSILWQYAPWMLSVSLIVGACSYIFPKVSALVIEFVLGIEIGSSS